MDEEKLKKKARRAAFEMLLAKASKAILAKVGKDDEPPAVKESPKKE